MRESQPAWWQKGMRRRRDGLLEWRFYVKTPAGSKQVSAYGRTITALKADRKRVEQRYEFAPKRLTVNELLDRYVEKLSDEKTVDNRKVADMKSRFKRLIRPKLGQFDLASLCSNWVIIGDHFDELAKRQPNSYVVQRTFDELKRAFAFGVNKQLCTMNPVLQLKRPAYGAEREREPFTVNQVLDLLALANGRNRLIITFLVMTAVRAWSEMSGLRVRDLNLLQRTVTLTTFVRRDAKGRPVEKPHVPGKPRGKTERAVREIPLVAPLVKLLESHIAAEHLGPADYLFPNELGGLLRDNNWRRRIWKPLVFAIGRPDAVPHELRHTTNSLLAQLGVDPETRAAICGHSETVNKKIYTTITLEAQRAGMDRLGDLFPDLRLGLESDGKKSRKPKSVA